jgi:hypothetical protein
MIPEHREEHNKRLVFLQEVVPPDDIYNFAEQALCCAEALMEELLKNVPFVQAANNQYVARAIGNICGFRNQYYNNDKRKLNL